MLKDLKTKTIKLSRNLVKTIKRGNPWLYKDSIEVPAALKEVCLAKIEYKKESIAWAYYDPNSVLSVRILSLEKKAPDEAFFIGRLERAALLREHLYNNPDTNCFRLINGEGDLLPGLVCDIYADLAVLQVDGPGPEQVWDLKKIADYLVKKQLCKFVYFKARHDQSIESKFLSENKTQSPVLVKENNSLFWVDFMEGQKTGFFLDQRNNRNYLKAFCHNKTVLNLFSYTGGFSIYAGLGGAKKVTSVDIAKPAANYVTKNWIENKLEEEKSNACSENVFSFLESLSSTKESFDVIIVDPPSFAPNEKQKAAAIQSYTEIFALAASKLSPQGDIFFSSCSSHINGEEFIDICQEAISKARKRAQLIYVGGQGEDHPFLLSLRHMQYLKFIHLKSF